MTPAQLRRLQLVLTRKVHGLLAGEHLGFLPGPGSEPGEARLYVPGDDVRRIDWSVTARTTVPHVRDAVAERELETTLVVDLSPSMALGSRRMEKRELALTLCAAVAHLASGPGDRVGALALTDDGLLPLRPRTGRAGVTGLLSALARVPRAADGSAGPGLAEALRRSGRPPIRRGLVVVVSDLLDHTDWPAALRQLRQRSEVIVAQVGDPLERELPEVGVLRVVDPETGRQLEVPTARRRVRERYAAAAAARTTEQARAVRAAGADHLVVATDRDWLPDLARFLNRRRRTRAAGRVPEQKA